MTARDEVLSRVRRAIGESQSLPIERGYRTRGDLDPGSPALIELLIDRLLDYKAAVVRCADSDDAIASAVSGVMRERSIARLVVPAGGSGAWLPDDQALLDEPPLTTAELDAVS